MRLRTLGSRQKMVTRDANDQGAGTSVRCRCSWCSLAVAMRNNTLEHSHCHRLWSFRIFVGIPRGGCRLAGSHLFLGWCLELTAAASAEDPSCAASPTLLLLRPITQSPHRSRPRPSLCGSSYIHTFALYHHHQLTCDHLSYTPVACIQQPHVARPA